MDKQVEEKIRCCHPCQLVGHSPRPEPVNPTTLPQQPWSKLAIDVCGPFPTGKQVVVLTDLFTLARSQDLTISNVEEHPQLVIIDLRNSWFS